MSDDDQGVSTDHLGISIYDARRKAFDRHPKPGSPEAVRRTSRERPRGVQSTTSRQSAEAEDLSRHSTSLLRRGGEHYLKLVVMLHEGQEIIVHVENLERPAPAPGEERCCR